MTSDVDLTDVENRMMRECMYKAGAKRVLVIEKPFASAVREIPPNMKYHAIIEITA